MSPHEYDDEWGCTLTANNEIQFGSGKDDKRIQEEENEDYTMPKDG